MNRQMTMANQYRLFLIITFFLTNVAHADYTTTSPVAPTQNTATVTQDTNQSSQDNLNGDSASDNKEAPDQKAATNGEDQSINNPTSEVTANGVTNQQDANTSSADKTSPPVVTIAIDPDVQQRIRSISYDSWKDFSKAIVNCDKNSFNLISLNAEEELKKFNVSKDDPKNYRDQLQKLFDSLFTNYQIIGWQDGLCVVNIDQPRKIALGSNSMITTDISFSCSFNNAQLKKISEQALPDNAKALYQRIKTTPEAAFLPISEDIFSASCSTPTTPQNFYY